LKASDTSKSHEGGVQAFALGTKLLALDGETSIIAIAPANKVNAACGFLNESGRSLEGVFPEAKRILHKKVTVVWGDEKKRTIEVKYFSATAVLSNSIGRESFHAPDAETFQAVFEAYRSRLGASAEVTRQPFSPARSLVAPAGVAALIAFSSWFLIGGFGNLKEAGSSPKSRLMVQAIDWVVSVIGEAGVLAIGALAILFCGWWAYQRYRNPPILVTLKPGKR